MNALIISGHYSPGHISHLEAYFELFNKLGYETRLLLNSRYEWAFKNDERVVYIGESSVECEIAVAVVYNISTVDVRIIGSIRKAAHFRSFFVYHEPWRGLAFWFSELLSGHASLPVVAKSVVIHHFSKKTVRHVDCVLLPSSEAEHSYLNRDARFNGTYRRFPLIYKDEVTDAGAKNAATYFSYIATADEKRNFPLYIDFITRRLASDADFRAQLVTRTKVDRTHLSQLSQYIDSKRFLVVSGKDLSNEELNEAFLRSKAVWLLYRFTTQSGVLARAFMCGCPVLASDVGCLGEYVDGQNGLVCASEDIDDINDAYDYIRDNCGTMRQYARESFKQFHYSNYIELMSDIISSIPAASSATASSETG